MNRRIHADRADVAQLVERRLPKPKVAGSRPVVRFGKPSKIACGWRSRRTDRINSGPG
jgi:hypothetical protein